jgi:hypothetical protein
MSWNKNSSNSFFRKRMVRMSKITGFVDDVPVHDELVYFNDWLQADTGQTKEELRESLIADGKSEGDIEAHFEDLDNIFHSWSEANDLTPQSS